MVTLKDNLAELFYFLLRKYYEKTAIFFLTKFSRVAVELPINIISKTMVFRYEHKKTRFSYIDCFGYIYTLEDGGFFLTGDRVFKGMRNVELVR